jgi:2-iminobutanoate/2-iminopropanoate deaminase
MGGKKMPDSNSPVPITTNQAPAAIGPYSQGVVAGNLLFISGQLPLNPATGDFVAGGIEERAHQCLKNIKAIAEAAGTGLDRAVKFTVFLTNMNDFTKINHVYAQYFNATLPARSAVQVAALPKNSDIEIEAILTL